MLKQLLSYKVLVPLAIILAIIPPGQPHLLEKSRMLSAGTLTKPIDIFDLFWHAWPLLLIAIRVGRDLGRRLVPVRQG